MLGTIVKWMVCVNFFFFFSYFFVVLRLHLSILSFVNDGNGVHMTICWILIFLQFIFHNKCVYFFSLSTFVPLVFLFYGRKIDGWIHKMVQQNRSDIQKKNQKMWKERKNKRIKLTNGKETKGKSISNARSVYFQYIK